MSTTVVLAEEHAAIFRDVLRAHLPAGAHAYVFGSRADGSARRFSDLDLAIEADAPLGLDMIGEIADALSESDLPFKVGVLDVAVIDPTFKAIIAPAWVPLQF